MIALADCGADKMCGNYSLQFEQCLLTITVKRIFAKLTNSLCWYYLLKMYLLILNCLMA